METMYILLIANDSAMKGMKASILRAMLIFAKAIRNHFTVC